MAYFILDCKMMMMMYDAAIIITNLTPIVYVHEESADARTLRTS